MDDGSLDQPGAVALGPQASIPLDHVGAGSSQELTKAKRLALASQAAIGATSKSKHWILKRGAPLRSNAIQNNQSLTPFCASGQVEKVQARTDRIAIEGLSLDQGRGGGFRSLQGVERPARSGRKIQRVVRPQAIALQAGPGNHGSVIGAERRGRCDQVGPLPPC